MAGHSLGEYTALVASGALSFADALPLVRYRAQCMQQAVPEGVGGIAAILGLEDEVVRAVCQEVAHGEVLEAVNYNSPGQVVIAGNRTAVERGMALAKVKGAKRAIMLPMSVPSHCSLLKGAAEQLSVYLDEVALKPPLIPVLQNADVAAYSDAALIKNALVRQLYSPVRWVETVLAFGKLDITHNVECAPGRILAGLNKRIDTQQVSLAMNDAAALTQALLIFA
jgi:[acyl-carrier-protein] S-malonyltransferase